MGLEPNVRGSRPDWRRESRRCLHALVDPARGRTRRDPDLRYANGDDWMLEGGLGLVGKFRF